MVESMDQTGMVRRDGKVVEVPAAWKTRAIDFGDGRPAHSMTLKWGDVVTAYKSTGIPNIMVYTAVPARAKAHNDLWGEARAADGQTAVSRLRTPEGYTLTARMSLSIAQKICSGQHTPGFQTPSTAYGKDLILELPGTERIDD
jgi:short subunit dehydrogenase-like uncharacterized protein